MFFSYFNQKGKYRQILVTVSDIKVYYNPSSGIRSVPCGKEKLTDGYNKANSFFSQLSGDSAKKR
jgi:glucan-binding YG repeat protein